VWFKGLAGQISFLVYFAYSAYNERRGTTVRIALVHYHLRRGGVSSVLRSQARMISAMGGEVLVVSGEPAGEGFLDGDIPVSVAEGLGYDPPSAERSGGEGGELAETILSAIDRHWAGGADVIHVHNPLIRKNSRLIPALRVLAEKGCPVLLQNHDLAEDFRPDVYAEGTEYPGNCHYAVINSRDYAYLRQAGLTSEGLHLIPNEVVPVRADDGLERTRYLYPVRGIRRKNIGEALLLSMFIPGDRILSVTLPPAGAEGSWRRWTALAENLGLPMEFGAGLTHTLAELYGSACRVITTSVKEGFGFSFLEPWTAGRFLSGRRIDYVCGDFEEAGVRFDSLYSSIQIPLEYISVRLILGKMERAIEKVYEAFGLSMPLHIESMMKDNILSLKTMDFGRLDEESQESVIRMLFFNREARRDIVSLNPFLGDLENPGEDSSLADHNREVIAKMYGRERIAEILFDAYKAASRPVTHKLSRQVLLDLYLDPLRFSLVGTGSGQP
jgi:glycosyltransferase involved in cell wall biosynthesis